MELENIRHGDFVACEDGSRFIVRDGKWFGPTAWMQVGTQWYVKYQASSLQVVVQEIHEKHRITKVVRGRLRVLLKMLHIEFNW